MKLEICSHHCLLCSVRVVSRETGERLVTVNARYVEHHHLIYNITPRPDDVWIVTHPKCGTTWTQEIVWNIVSGAEEVTSARTPFIDGPMIFGDTDPQQFFKDFHDLPSPRIIKVKIDFFFMHFMFFMFFSRLTTPLSYCHQICWMFRK